MAMELSKEEVIKIAKLARIALSADEVVKFQKDLTSILNYVAQLREVKTDKVAPTNQVTGLVNVRRKDEVDYNFTREEILASALEQSEGHLKVKNIF